MDLIGEHTPRMRYVLLLVGAGLVALWLSIIIDPIWLPIGTGAILIGLGMFEAVLLGKAAHDETMKIYAEVIGNFAKLTEAHLLHAQFSNIPFVRGVWERLPVKLWGDTQSPFDEFDEFVKLSNKQTTCSSRAWIGAGRKRIYWEEIIDWLIRNQFIDGDRPLQNESYRWLPGKWDSIQRARPNVKTYPRLQNDERVNIMQAETGSPTDFIPLEGG